ncbi:MAG TPA: hypothetical protein VN653_09250, partial [Anaerolineales bacterium]|nr:hypothetical protein [Anaerolineales bacterium]
MLRIKKILGWWIIIMVSACQALPTPAPTATATITPGPSPTPTFTPTGTPLPTPVPVLRIDSGDTALFNGEYDEARALYQSAYNDSTDNGVKAAALWGLGRTELADGNDGLALDQLTTLTNEYSASTYSARA